MKKKATKKATGIEKVGDLTVAVLGDSADNDTPIAMIVSGHQAPKKLNKALGADFESRDLNYVYMKRTPVGFDKVTPDVRGAKPWTMIWS